MRIAIQFFSIIILLTQSVAHADESLHVLIDQQIEDGLVARKIEAAESCSDAGFMRRISLDLTGTIPTANAVREFLASTTADKRTKLIDQLLDSDEFAQHMAAVFDVLLMQRRVDKYVTTGEWRAYLAESFAVNKPLDQLATEILGADGVDEKLRPAAKFYLDRAVNKDMLVRDIGRVFLGVDLQCAQCHNHPGIDDYLHQHYHGLSVFVAGSKTFKQPDGTMVLQEMVTREIEFASVFQPDNTQKTGPRILQVLLDVPEVPEGEEEYIEKPSRKVRAVPKFSLRKLLSEKLPSNATPEFGRNMANRLWAMMMGRGLVHPLDMHHSGNPPSHPELLELLAKRLAESKFDMKSFLRELALSKTYQRSSLVPADVDANTLPPESYAVANMKGLSPEQLFQSLLQATGSHRVLEAQIEETLKEDEEAYKALAADMEKHMQARADGRAVRLKEFVGLFDTDGGFQASLTQALFIANSETVISWIEPGHDNLAARVAKNEDNSQLLDEIYVNIVSRLPTDEELQVFNEHVEKKANDRTAAIVEIIWALVASSEFRLNH